TMEKYSESTRFILSANYSSKIIEPIQSRTAVFRFRRLEDEHVEEYIEKVAEGEGLEVDSSGMDALIQVSGGDLRKVTNVMQAASIEDKDIDEEAVFEISASLRPEEVRDILEDALAGDFQDARDELSDLMIDRGLDGQDVLKSIHREVFDLGIPEKHKLEMIRQMGEYEFRIIEGGSPDVQIESFLAQVANLDE
ncbi:MAG: replication factor C small subunit, partial [Candidatus Nanohaloarchaea archaeon]